MNCRVTEPRAAEGKPGQTRDRHCPNTAEVLQNNKHKAVTHLPLQAQGCAVFQIHRPIEIIRNADS